MNELKPVAVIYVDEEKVGMHGRRISWLENPMSISEETNLYAISDTHRVVSVELLKRLVEENVYYASKKELQSIIDNKEQS